MGYESVYTPPSASAGNFVPPAANTYDLGSTSAEWRAIYLGEGASSGAYFGTDQHARLYSDGTDFILDLASGEIVVEGDSVTNQVLSLHSHTNSNALARLEFKNSSNTHASPTATTTSHALGQIQVEGHDGTNYVRTVQVQFFTEGTITTGQVPTGLDINLMNNSGTLANRFRFTPDGDLAINASNRIYFDGVAATGHTFMEETTADVFDIYVGGSRMIAIDGSTQHISFAGGANNGFKFLFSGAFGGTATGTSAYIGIYGSIIGAANQITHGISLRSTLQEAATGTHAYMDGILSSMTYTAGASATTTQASAFRIATVPAFGTRNYAILIDANGNIAFGGSVDSAAVADEVSLGAYEIGAGQRALAISQEYDALAEVDETKFSHKLPVQINGATKYIMLTDS